MELRSAYMPGGKPESAALNLGVSRAAYADAPKGFALFDKRQALKILLKP